MLKAYKTEINPTKQQKQKINQSIGICRYLYNSYLAKNDQLYIQLKEKGYIPTNENIMSGTISKKADRYFVSVLIEVEEKHQLNTNQGIGIDLGLKDFAICSNEITKKNINKTNKVKKLEKKLKREQKQLSRKYESLKQRNKDIKKEGGIATRQNIQKQKLKVQKLHQTLYNIRENYLNQIVNELVKTKPSHITIEDLNVRGMMKNRHLSKAISKQGFNMFRVKLNNKCNEYGIELRIVDRYYPSSKTCHECGSIKNDLKLSDRVYICKECGCAIDRDLNASLNLKDAKIYKIA